MTQENKNIQPQAEPYIVKSHDIHIDNDYADWIADIKNRYRSAQVKAAVKVNAEKLLFNWQLGRDLVQKKAEERWGAGVVEQVSLDLNREFPDSTNFSVRNLWYMKQWYMFYAENPEKLKQLVSVMLPDDSHDKIIKQIEDGEKLKQSVSEFPLPFACVPWGHHVRIVQHSKTIEEALFYVGYTIREGISRDILARVMKDDVYKKQGTVPNNFSQHLTPQLAQRYVFLPCIANICPKVLTSIMHTASFYRQNGKNGIHGMTPSGTIRKPKLTQKYGKEKRKARKLSF